MLLKIEEPKSLQKEVLHKVGHTHFNPRLIHLTNRENPGL